MLQPTKTTGESVISRSSHSLSGRSYCQFHPWLMVFCLVFDNLRSCCEGPVVSRTRGNFKVASSTRLALRSKRDSSRVPPPLSLRTRRSLPGEAIPFPSAIDNLHSFCETNVLCWSWQPPASPPARSPAVLSPAFRRLQRIRTPRTTDIRDKHNRLIRS